MTDNTLRNAIARALDRQIVDEVRARRIHIEVRNGGWAELELRLADAVLAVLADLPDDVIERVRELHKGQVDDFGDRFCVTCWSSDWPCLTLQAIGESDD